MCCVMGYTGHDLPAEKFKEYLLRTVDRGPDDQRVVEGPYGLMGFGRLAIMGLTPEGMQPFYRGADCVVCNGELYGFRFEKEILKRRGYKFCSDCDCEILLPLYYEYGLDMFRHMDAVSAEAGSVLTDIGLIFEPYARRRGGRFGRKCRSGGCAGPGGMAGTDEADYTQRFSSEKSKSLSTSPPACVVWNSHQTGTRSVTGCCTPSGSERRPR